MNLKEVERLHKQAMNLAEEAWLAGLNGNDEQAQQLTLEAFKLERQAADLMVDELDVQPTRSVL